MKKILSLLVMFMACAASGMAQDIQKLYLYGDPAGEWSPTKAAEMIFNEETQAFEYEIENTIKTYFAVGTELKEGASWDEFNGGYRYAIDAGDKTATIGQEYTLQKVNGTIVVEEAGKFLVSITRELKMTITKVEEVQPELPETYAIVGNIWGETGWGDDHVMTQSADDANVYTLVVDEFEAEAKTYEYKLRANAKWGLYEIPSDGTNQKFEFGTPDYPAGTYKLTFTANVSENTLTLDVQPVSDMPIEIVIENMDIVGDFTGGWPNVAENDWSMAKAMTKSADNEYVWTLTVEGFEAEAKKYEYKAVANHNYDYYQLPIDGNQDFVFGTDEYPAGKYNLTFTADTENHTLTLVAVKVEEPLLNTYTVKLSNMAGWDEVYAYTWTGQGLDQNAEWPGVKLTATEEVSGDYIYTFQAAAAPEFIIFNNGKDGDEKKQTADLNFIDGTEYCNLYGAMFEKPESWENVYAYAWINKGEAVVELLGAFPGTKIEPVEDIYAVTFDQGIAPEKIIFSNGLEGEALKQTEDLDFESGKTYTFTEEPQPVVITSYTIVGDEALTGADWDVASTANEMTQNEAGIYEKTFERVNFTADMSFKVVANHDYTVGEWPMGLGNNWVISLTDTERFPSGEGTYSITITFDPNADDAAKINVSGTKTGDATGITAIGQFDSQKSANCYDLSGRRVVNGRTAKGLYIVNGRKTVIK